MEYLMTYGWAILVVMLVGVAMWQMGIFNLGGSTGTTASGFPRIKPLLSTAAYYASNDEFNVTFANGAGGTISIADGDVSVNGNSDDCSVTPNEVRTGDTFSLACDFTDGGPGSYAGASGDPYVANIIIGYTVTSAGQTISRTDSGLIRGPMEP
jgi:hypothetical protein